MSEAFEARVTGRVQAVGYRQYAQGHGARAGLSGWVRNNDDGSVAVHAEGGRPELEAFLENLKRGPYFARVRTVEVTWITPSGVSGFEIND